MTDLSPERLDELERNAIWAINGRPDDDYWVHPDETLALIAMAHDKQAAERERDALRGVLEYAVEWGEGGFDFCFSCTPDDETVGHEGWCWVHHARVALAQPTTEGGE